MARFETASGEKVSEIGQFATGDSRFAIPINAVAWPRRPRYSTAARRIRAWDFGPEPIAGRDTVPDEIEEKVIEIVSEQMGVDKSEITRETSFVNDLNADSLDTVELVMEFEDEFELSIPDEEAEKIQTVGQAIDYIREHSSKA
jgi:acyl carrier protein